jgi:AcrR family transcriptional regulator
MRSVEASTDRPELTRDRILEAAETVLKRYGPTKTTVVDVARALGMSHANVYRHFESKAALLDALVERWLTAVYRPLAAIAERQGPADERLEAWFLKLIALKRRKVLDEPELFATYHAAALATRGVIETHIARHRTDLVRIIRAGIENGELAVSDPDAAAAALLDATKLFVDPHHIAATKGRSSDKDVERDARRVLRLVIAGLKAGVL